MCGIAGIFRRTGCREADFGLLPQMANLLHHRGPDDFGYAFLNSQEDDLAIGKEAFRARPVDVSLANRRLSIIDLTPAGAQPVTNETGDLIAVFNGEIFNYVELREYLVARGHVFRSQSDSEVIVHSYEEWGASCAERFNGMWAIAIWDQQRRQLFCSRDRFGIKPLYYFCDRDTFIFASEAKAILPALDQRVTADMRVIREFLVAGMLGTGEDTFFDGIKRLPPARNLTVSAGDLRVTRYWDYHTQSEGYSHSEPVQTFRNLFDDSVRIRLRSDVPVGVALSGGLDSASVLASVSNTGYNGDIKAFTAVFPDQPYNEYEHARVAADAVGADLHCVEYRPDMFMDDLRKVVWFLDYPAQEGQVVLRWKLMELASKHVKVILEGQGADEMLAGYPWRYSKPFFDDEVTRLHLLNVARMLVRKYRFTLVARARSFMHSTFRTKRSTGVTVPFVPPYRDEFLATEGIGHFDDDERQFPDRLTEKMHLDHACHILPKLLKYGDAMSMASSIESRLPFLDHRLVEFVFQLPYYHKFDGRVAKGILRHAMANRVPKSILARRDKVGFETPVAQWIDATLQNEIEPMLMEGSALNAGIFDKDGLGRFIENHRSAPTKPGAYEVFRWLSVELWFQQFINT